MEKTTGPGNSYLCSTAIDSKVVDKTRAVTTEVGVAALEAGLGTPGRAANVSGKSSAVHVSEEKAEARRQLDSMLQAWRKAEGNSPGVNRAIERIEKAFNTGATLLDLSSLKLTSLTPAIRFLPSLNKLYLDNNKLTQLPLEIGELTSLGLLHLDNNKLTQLPPQIGELTSLGLLDLDKNGLTTLPLEIGKLTSLKLLKLDNNELTELPPQIGELTSLGTLNLINNKLTQLPPEIGKLTSLILLDLGDNELTELPIMLTSLKELNISYTNAQTQNEIANYGMQAIREAQQQDLPIDLEEHTDLLGQYSENTFDFKGRMHQVDERGKWAYIRWMQLLDDSKIPFAEAQQAVANSLEKCTRPTMSKSAKKVATSS